MEDWQKEIDDIMQEFNVPPVATTDGVACKTLHDVRCLVNYVRWLSARLSYVQDTMRVLIEDRAILRSALEWYGDYAVWNPDSKGCPAMRDYGQRARDALRR